MKIVNKKKRNIASLGLKCFSFVAMLFLLGSCTSAVYNDPAYMTKKRNCDIALSHLHDKKFHMQQCGGNIIVY